VKYKPNYFGKHGFHAVAESAVKEINVGELHDVSERLPSERTAKQEEKDVTLDLESLGYDKLLGKGKISRPLIVKVKEYSKKAAEKVEAAGGRIAKLE
jgi:large subunit ribosomal protein L15